jgi:hypothetical protein
MGQSRLWGSQLVDLLLSEVGVPQPDPCWFLQGFNIFEYLYHPKDSVIVIKPAVAVFLKTF